MRCSAVFILGLLMGCEGEKKIYFPRPVTMESKHWDMCEKLCEDRAGLEKAAIEDRVLRCHCNDLIQVWLPVEGTDEP